MRLGSTVALLLGLIALTAAAAPSRPLEGSVVHVVDGDTIHVRLGDRVAKVRYLGINAPEIPRSRGRGEARAPGGRGGHRHFARGPAAGDAARRINLELVSGKRVRLELDRQRRDPHQRLLAYVWVGDTMVNAEMVKRGYAEVMSIPPDFHHRALLAKLEAEAREAGRGLWQASARVNGRGAARPHGRSAR